MHYITMVAALLEVCHICFSPSLALFSLDVLYFVYIKPCYADDGSN